MTTQVKTLAAAKAEILLRVRSLQSVRLAVGVLGPKGEAQHEDSTLSVAEIATVNHFGDGRIPARPFLTIAQQQHREVLQDLLARATRAVIDRGADPEKALGLVGEGFRGAVVETIADGVAPENAPSTIKRKGSSKPLIDSGQLRQSISWQIRHR